MTSPTRAKKQAFSLGQARPGVSLLEVLLMLTALSATILPVALMLSQTGQNARETYVQSSRSLLINTLPDFHTVDRNRYDLYSLGAMATNTSESGQVLPWRSVLDTTNAGASDSFKKTMYYYFYNTASDAANAPRYSTEAVYTRDVVRTLFATGQLGFMDSSGQWWDGYNQLSEGPAVPGISTTIDWLDWFPSQAISNMPSHRDADLYRGGWWEENGPAIYTVPVSNGLYTVKLYFTDHYHNTSSWTITDILIEGKLMNPDSPYSAPGFCGGQYCANVQMYDVMVTDGNLNIQLNLNSQNSYGWIFINAISIKKRT